MTLILHRSDVGEDLRAPQTLAPRRRRLSTLAVRRVKGRPCIVSVHRKGALLQPSDDTVRLRKDWRKTLVGPHDTVVITYLPLGGAMGGSSGGGGKAIGAAVAAFALAVAAPWLVGAIAPSLGLGGVLGTTAGLTLAGKVVAAGIVAGAAYLLSKATQAKANTEADSRPVYGVSGGGNLPRPGDRIPINYGRVWHQPDLSQADYFIYTGGEDSDQILLKKVTVGAGPYKVHAIRVGQALMWTENGGLRPPFTKAQVEILQPGEESDLVPGAVYSSESVAGTELPAQEGDIEWIGPFPVTEPGVLTKRIQIDYTWPQGYWIQHPKRPNKMPCSYGIIVQYAEIDEDGRVIGPWRLLFEDIGEGVATRAVRKTKFVNVPSGRWAVRARNHVTRLLPELEEQGVSAATALTWDGLRAHLFNEPLRPDVQEIAMKISAEAMGSTMTFSDIWVETTKILPIWNGSAWVEQPTRKAVWAALDILRNRVYGGAYPDSKIDLDTFRHYALTLNEHDTFDGQIRGPVSVYEAAATVLGVIRAEPTMIGDVWSMVRDEPRPYAGHVITRRQIVKDTSGADFDLDVGGGESDIIGEYFVDGDTNRRGEVRATIGAQTLTPTRKQLFGVSDHDHAYMLAKWFAASAYYRRETRSLTMERAGRIVERNDRARIDTWFLDTTVAVGVDARAGLTLTLDADVTLPAGTHAVLRDQQGQEWGPLAITASGPRTITLDADDVAVIEQTTGRTLTSLFGKPNRRLPVTALIGTLTELARPYIIRTAKPEGLDRIQITAVYDAPEVWQVLGEAIPPAPPIKEVILDEAELTPILPWVRAHLVQKATALVLEWAAAGARGCRLYRVDIAYGAGGEWQNIHYAEATSGSYVVEYREGVEVQVRAYAINGRGVPSDPVFTTVQLFKPVINSEIADLILEMEMLSEQVKRDIRAISEIGERTLRDNLKKLNDKVEELASAAATEDVHSYEQRNLIKVAIDNAHAAILEEARLRVSEDEALAELITTITARLNDPETGLSASASAIESLQTRVSTTEGSIEAVAERTTTLESRANNPTTGFTALAQLTQDLKTAVGLTGTGGEATATFITSLSAQINGSGGVITQLSSVTATANDAQGKVNNVRLEHGVAFTVDGAAVGGYRLTGFRRLDGSFQSEFGIHGDLVVTGTIQGAKLRTDQAIITGQLQVGSLVVHNESILDSAVSNDAADASTGLAAMISINVRGGRVLILATYYGQPGTLRPIGNAGTLRILRDGNEIRSLTNNHYIIQGNSGAGLYTLQTTIIAIDRPAKGVHTYRVEDDFMGGVAIYVLELSK